MTTAKRIFHPSSFACPILLFAFAFLIGNRESLAQASADHDSLVAIREQFTKALNERDFEAMKPLVADDFTFVAVNNEKVSGVEELKAYWDKLFTGDKSLLKSLTVAPVADAKTVFFGDSVGVAQGTSNDVYDIRAVGRREMKSRWTAVVTKVDGNWKVARVHMSANILDNPVLQATKGAGRFLPLILGILAGLIIGAMLFRRKKSSA